MFHPLESRRLLSNSVFQHVLTVTGTAKSDTITVALQGNVYIVTENGTASQFNAKKIRSVVVNAGDGDDVVMIQGATVSIQDLNSPPEDLPFPAEVHGQGGDDYLRGGTSNDTLYGEAGNDSLFGDEGDDALFGGGGKDTLDGSFGDDLMSGGAGVDTVTYHSEFSSVSISNDGVKNDITFSTLVGKRTIESTDNILSDVENLIGGNENDVIKGNNADNYIDGGIGNDTINGGGGNDTLNGNFGDDDIYGGAGNADVVYYADRITRLNVTLDNARNDGAHATATRRREMDFVHDDIENVWGGRNADYMAGNSRANTLEGGNGNDTLIGNGGADLLSGGPGTNDISP